jgi:hypothetical protein
MYQDLWRGDCFEEFLLRWIKKKYPKSTREKSNKYYDIHVPELGLYIECKADYLSAKTGNVFIEYQNNDGTPSGIYYSKAAYWAIAFFKEETPMHCFITREKLVELCSFSEIKQGKENSMGYCVPVGDLIRYASRVNLTP